jgi:hypothetical protein
MNVKGTAVGSIPEFVKQQFPNRYGEWIVALNDDSARFFRGSIVTSSWYPIRETLIDPLKVNSKLFFEGDDEKAARTMGSFSADLALTGVYRFFVKFGTPKFLIERAGSLMRTYFDPCSFTLIQESPKRLIFIITDFPESDEVVEWNIAGWIERALTISGSVNPTAKVIKSMAKDDGVTEIEIQWD